MIKKSYLSPTATVVTIDFEPLLTTSFSETLDGTDTISDPEDILSPELQSVTDF